MSGINIPPFYNAPAAQRKQTQSTDAGRSSRAGTQSQQPSGAASTGDPTDIITTSPEAGALLGALNSQLSLSSTESQKDFDAKQLKAAIQQLHILQLLGIGLGPEQLAKQTTALAKQIAGIAKDYADNSGSAPAGAASTASATGSATSEADTAASQATQAAKTSADTVTQSAQAAAGATDAATSSSSASSTSQGTAATDTDQQAADDPNGFFGEVAGAFKDLKKLETKALSQLNLSPDKAKKKEAKKLGGEFNDAVLSATQSANAVGAKGAASELAGQSIDLSKVTLNISV